MPSPNSSFATALMACEAAPVSAGRRLPEPCARGPRGAGPPRSAGPPAAPAAPRQRAARTAAAACSAACQSQARAARTSVRRYTRGSWTICGSYCRSGARFMAARLASGSAGTAAAASRPCPPSAGPAGAAHAERRARGAGACLARAAAGHLAEEQLGGVQVGEPHFLRDLRERLAAGLLGRQQRARQLPLACGPARRAGGGRRTSRAGLG
jgi:hypothetical protein